MMTQEQIRVANAMLRNIGDPPAHMRVVRLQQMREWTLSYLECVRAGMAWWCK